MQDRALIEAVRASDISAAEEALDSGSDVNQTDEQGWTPLNFAAGKGDFAIVKLLLAGGADIFKTGRDNRTPCMIALAAGRIEVAKYLIEVEDKIDAERAGALMPERKYCKAYYLRDLRKFPSWSETRIDWWEKKDHKDEQQPPKQLADDDIVFIHQDLRVTESMWHDENIVFDRVDPEWRAFCSSNLRFEVPSDLELATTHYTRSGPYEAEVSN